jgi:hypothetical protein
MVYIDFRWEIFKGLDREDIAEHLSGVNRNSLGAYSNQLLDNLK